MTRRRFYAPPESFAPDGAEVMLSVEESRHLRDVLRLRTGEEVSVFDGEGREFACVIAEMGGRGRNASARLEVQSEIAPPSAESPLELTLAVALLKGEKFDLVVQKATELGASRIVPLMTMRADVRLRDERDGATRVERWRRLALEAAKQSGRARLPAIERPAAFSSIISLDTDGRNSLRLMFAERGGSSIVGSKVDESARAGAVTALVGPEGGWDAAEISDAAAAGWRIVTLGGRVLRAETAAITAAVLVQHIYGDLR